MMGKRWADAPFEDVVIEGDAPAENTDFTHLLLNSISGRQNRI
jgi:hypothetical protein